MCRASALISRVRASKMHTDFDKPFTQLSLATCSQPCPQHKLHTATVLHKKAQQIYLTTSPQLNLQPNHTTQCQSLQASLTQLAMHTQVSLGIRVESLHSLEWRAGLLDEQQVLDPDPKSAFLIVSRLVRADHARHKRGGDVVTS